MITLPPNSKTTIMSSPNSLITSRQAPQGENLGLPAAIAIASKSPGRYWPILWPFWLHLVLFGFSPRYNGLCNFVKRWRRNVLTIAFPDGLLKCNRYHQSAIEVSSDWTILHCSPIRSQRIRCQCIIHMDVRVVVRREKLRGQKLYKRYLLADKMRILFMMKSV